MREEQIVPRQRKGNVELVHRLRAEATQASPLSEPESAYPQEYANITVVVLTRARQGTERVGVIATVGGQ